MGSDNLYLQEYLKECDIIETKLRDFAEAMEVPYWRMITEGKCIIHKGDKTKTWVWRDIPIVKVKDRGW